MDKLSFTNGTSFIRFQQLVREYVANDVANEVAIVRDYGENWEDETNFKHWYWLHAKLMSRRMYAEEGGVDRSNTGCKSIENICVAMYNIGQIDLLFKEPDLFNCLFLLCAAIGDVREQCTCFNSDEICEDCGECTSEWAPSYKETDKNAQAC